MDKKKEVTRRAVSFIAAEVGKKPAEARETFVETVRALNNQDFAQPFLQWHGAIVAAHKLPGDTDQIRRIMFELAYIDDPW